MTLLKPPAVAPGASVRILSPASYAQTDRIDDGLAALRALGYVPALSANALARGPLFYAGTVEQRQADLHDAFAEEETHAIMAVRGGYGANYLLENLDLEAIAKHPKPFLAYSDLTGVQLRLLDEIDLPVFHGPMVAADFNLENGVHLASFTAALAGEPYSVGEAEGLRMLKADSGSGVVQGRLYGGCLTMIASLLKTDWEPNTEGTLLFIEDREVKPYQVDRLLWQLRRAGKFEEVQGIIFGEMLDCVSPGSEPDLLEKTILSALDGFEGPIAFGLRSGHVTRENVTLTFGVQTELTWGSEARLNLLEPAVEK